MLLTSQFAVEFNPNNYAVLLMPQRVSQHCAFSLPLFCYNVLFPRGQERLSYPSGFDLVAGVAHPA